MGVNPILFLDAKENKSIILFGKIGAFFSVKSRILKNIFLMEILFGKDFFQSP
jgi:hypothetical protein